MKSVEEEAGYGLGRTTERAQLEKIYFFLSTGRCRKLQKI
jgi:hypothetical protein